MGKRKQVRKSEKIKPTEVLDVLKQLTPEQLQALISNLDISAPISQSPTPQKIMTQESPNKPERPTTRQSDGSSKPKVFLQGESKGKRPPIVQSMSGHRPNIDEVNKFDPDKYRDTATFDTEWQKTRDPIYKGAKPTERRENYAPIEINCKRCGKHYSVPPSFLIFDADDKQWTFLCDKCAPRAG